jgi:hypothetical protein
MSELKLPDEIRILGIPYKVEYCEKPSDVDLCKRESLWGQIDYWTRTIRVFKGARTEQDIWDTIWHEILHGLTCDLKISIQNDKQSEEDKIDLLAMGIREILFSNDWIKKG